MPSRLKTGELWYYRPTRAVITDIASAYAVIVHLMSFNHLNQTTTQYIHIFDNATIPEDGARPLVELQVGPKGMASYTPALGGRKFNKGVVVALSSTPVVLTKTTLAELTYQVEGVAA
jgi:hypothetical protein